MKRLVLLLGLLCSPAIAEPVVVQAVGDLCLSGNAEPEVRARKGYDFAFDGTRALLAEGDLNIANLETAITTRGKKVDKTFTFRQPPESLDAIKKAGFGLVSLANNHSGDYGPVGLIDTLEHLDQRGIARAGAGRDVKEARAPAIVEVKGTKVGFLSYSLTFPKEFWADKGKPGCAFGHESWVRADVAALKEKAEVVLVAFHWGAEKMTTPKDYQRALGKAAIEAGADAVIGHHPHVLQGIELVNGKPVLYSLGNYAFGSNSNAAKDAALARLVFDSGRLSALELVPLNVHNRFVRFNPQVAEGEVQARILEELASLSKALGTETTVVNGRLVVPLETPKVEEPEPPVTVTEPTPEPVVAEEPKVEVAEPVVAVEPAAQP